jgi:hypothetical protein
VAVRSTIAATISHEERRSGLVRYATRMTTVSLVLLAAVIVFAVLNQTRLLIHKSTSRYLDDPILQWLCHGAARCSEFDSGPVGTVPN